MRWLNSSLPCILLCSVVGIAPARSASLDVTVRGADGKPVQDAVVSYSSTHRGASESGGARRTYVMVQRDIAFSPHVLVVPVGATVSFPNEDTVRHHVYSFSRPKKFQLKLYGEEQTRSVTFDKPGVVALGCNIHDRMSGFIVVVDTPFAAKTDGTGHVRLADVPTGNGTLQIWHPAVRGAGNVAAQPVAISAAGLTTSYTIGR